MILEIPGQATEKSSPIFKVNKVKPFILYIRVTSSYKKKDLVVKPDSYTREKPTALRNTKMVMWFPGFLHLAALVTEMGKPYGSRPF